jgi:plastocyanin
VNGIIIFLKVRFIMPKIVKIIFYLLLISLAACGSQEASGTEPQIIKVVDDEFSPNILRVEPGTTVIWESGGSNNHNVIASDGSWQAISSDYFEYGIITKGDQFEHTFTEPGIYEYYCPFHGTNDKGMVGTVIVGDVEYSVEITENNDTLSNNVLKVVKIKNLIKFRMLLIRQVRVI